MSRILFAGDPHGDFSEIHSAWNTYGHTPTVFVGDLGCSRPYTDLVSMHEGLHYFIDGNHDGDSEEMWTHLHVDPTWDIHGRVVDIDGTRVAGLGGVFRQRLWNPDVHSIDHVPTFTWEERVQPNKKRPARITQLSARQRVSIWPQYIRQLWGVPADILVCHEAPLPHAHGFGILNELARSMGVHTIIHGHHHIDYQRSSDGISIQGVGIGGVQDQHGQILIPGRYHPERSPSL